MTRLPVEVTIRVKSSQSLNKILKQVNNIIMDNPEMTLKIFIEIIP